MDSLENFKKIGLSDNIINALIQKGFEEPTKIQELTIPKLLKGEIDIIGQAQTGTGKTAAFALPLIELLEQNKRAVQALILTPTRELAIQVSEEINSLKGKKDLQIIPIYGGQSMEEQLRRLKKGVHIVVGTPGRILDHIRRKSLKLNDISFLILDEADEMLNMGFIDDVEEILKNTNSNKRMLLFSATMPDRILTLAKKYMRKNYELIGVKGEEQLTTNLIDQIYFEVSESDKLEALCRIIDYEHEFYGLIFCRTKNAVDSVTNRLVDRGYDAESLHGDISQSLREKILEKFKSQKINILVATDVAARGIDVVELTHVINYSLPQNPESYIHRIGRTGRAGKEGTAITFVTPDEYRKLLFIKRIAKTDIRKESVPKVKDIISKKKLLIRDKLSRLIESGNYDGYIKLAKDMLSDHQPEEILAALLKHTFHKELDETSYHEIKDFSKKKVSIDNKGKSRLFVALGETDGYNKSKLIELIKRKTRINPEKIRNVSVFEKFSFVTVPFEEAEIILSVFKKEMRGKRPIFEIAKPLK